MTTKYQVLLVNIIYVLLHQLDQQPNQAMWKIKLVFLAGMLNVD